MTQGPTKPHPEKLQGFYAELEALLRKQLTERPESQDVRLRLIELYFETHRPDAFLKAAHDFRRRNAKAAKSREWQRIASMGRMLLPGEPVFSGHDAESVEYIGPVDQPAPAPPGQRVRRFGDDPGCSALFQELSRQYDALRGDAAFLREFELLLLGMPTRRPTALVPAPRLSKKFRGAGIYFKREDFAGDNPHLTIAVIGQALVARRTGCTTLVTGTADGRRGVVVAAVAARLGMGAVIFCDSDSAERAAANLTMMRLMGARVELVRARDHRNGDIREAALGLWLKDPARNFLITGVDAAPAPYSQMTQEFTAAIGRELRRQMVAATRRPPDVVVTRGTRAADALGIVPAFIAEKAVRLACVDAEAEPAGDDQANPAGMTESQRKVALTIWDRIEYPSVAREHAWFRASGRVEYASTTRAAARDILHDCARLEAVLPPVESAHALAWACATASELDKAQTVVVVLTENLDKNFWDIRRLVENGKRT